MIASVATLTVVSLQPARPKTSPWMHREFHLAAFSIVAGLLRSLSTGRKADIAAALATILFGTVLEFAQSHFYRNVLEWQDIRSDAAGAILGVLCYHLVAAARLKTDAKQP
jgi:hypothetical protein